MSKPDWDRAATLAPLELGCFLDEDHDAIDDGPPATAGELAAMRVFRRKPGQRGPGKKPALVSVTLRLEPETVDHFKAGGAGWQGRIRDVLKGAAKRRA